jgi:Trk K+ transport system NAD-binding subunit
MILPMSGDVEGWTDHVIVCGLNRVGVRTAEQLRLAGVRVVVVDDQPDPRYARIIRGWGLPHIVGSSVLADTLSGAGLAGAAAVVCVQSDDLHTLETALLARELRADARVVVQLRNPAVGRALAGSGVAVLDVAGLSAQSVVGPCLGTGNHQVELGGAQFVVADQVVDRTGTLRDRYGDLAPVAVLPAGDESGAGGIVVCPGRDHPVRPGDVVTVLGTPAQLRDAGLSWRPATAGAARHRLGTRLRHLGSSLLDAVDRR